MDFDFYKWLGGISDDDIEWARSVGRRYEGDYLGKGDAARHLALGYLAANAVHHKKGIISPMALVQMREAGFDTPDNAMDRKNNELGFFISVNADDSKDKAEAIIHSLVKDLTVAHTAAEAKASKKPVILAPNTKANNYY